jgi:hypothetical protein
MNKKKTEDKRHEFKENSNTGNIQNHGIRFIFSIVGMPISEFMQQPMPSPLLKTVTLKKGETVYWTLASKERESLY